MQLLRFRIGKVEAKYRRHNMREGNKNYAALVMFSYSNVNLLEGIDLNRAWSHAKCLTICLSPQGLATEMSHIATFFCGNVTEVGTV